MSNIKRLVEDFYVFKSYYWEMNSGVLLDEKGWALIDPGYSPGELEEIDYFLKKRGKPVQSYLIYTHSDFDHIAGGHQFPLAKGIAQENFLHCFKEEQEHYLKEADEDQGIVRPGFCFPSPEITFQESLEITLENETIGFFSAPGHTRDSLFVVLKNKGVFLTGDTLSDQEFPLIYHNARQYKETLHLAGKILEEFEINYLVPGHGSWTDSREEMKKRVEQDIDYLDNLLDNIKDYFYQGLATAEILAVLREVRYKGDYIGGELMPVHEKNIKKVIDEVGDQL